MKKFPQYHILCQSVSHRNNFGTHLISSQSARTCKNILQQEVSTSKFPASTCLHCLLPPKLLDVILWANVSLDIHPEKGIHGLNRQSLLNIISCHPLLFLITVSHSHRYRYNYETYLM